MIDIKENISLKPYNTLRVDAQAKFFAVIQTLEEFSELLKSDVRKHNKYFILGGGANVLFTQNFDGIVVKNEIMGKEIVREDEDDVYVKVGSGESWPGFVSWCVGQNYGGIENLAFIPGTVGASAVGNIGAYGVEVEETIDQIDYIDLIDKKTHTVKNAECNFAYRESIFKQELKGKVFITSVTFKLRKMNGNKNNYKLNLDYKDIQHVIDEQKLDRETLTLKDVVGLIIAVRRTKLPDPEQIGTAGSFFKNPIVTEEKYLALKEKWPNLVSFNIDPVIQNLESKTQNLVKLSAGQLIELSGLKGYRSGSAGVSSMHALVLINIGNGTGEELMQLADHIISEVKKNFQVTLEPEVIYV